MNFKAIFRARTGAIGKGGGSRNQQLEETSFMDVPLPNLLKRRNWQPSRVIDTFKEFMTLQPSYTF